MLFPTSAVFILNIDQVINIEVELQNESVNVLKAELSHQ